MMSHSVIHVYLHKLLLTSSEVIFNPLYLSLPHPRWNEKSLYTHIHLGNWRHACLGTITIVIPTLEAHILDSVFFK